MGVVVMIAWLQRPKAERLEMRDLVMIRAALHTGAGPALSIIRAAEFAKTGSALQHLATRLISGETLSEIAQASLQADTTGRVIRVLAMADRCGSAAGPVVDEVISVIRQAERMAANVRAKQAEARVTATILIALPLIGLVIAVMSGEGAREFLTSTLGLSVLAIAAVLMALAAWWMAYLARGVARAARAVDPLVGRNGKQADPTAELIDLLALAMGAGMGPAQAFFAVAALTPNPQRDLSAKAARSWHMGHDPIEAMPDALHDVGLILAASSTWGAPVVPALRMQAEDLRARANEAALEAAEGLSARLVLPTTLLLMPAFMLVMTTPVLVPVFTSFARH